MVVSASIRSPIYQQLASREFQALQLVGYTEADFVTSETYGDSFISGFVEGGEFYALISIKASDQSHVTDIAASLSVNIDKGVAAVSGTGDGSYQKNEALKDATTTIRYVDL